MIKILFFSFRNKSQSRTRCYILWMLLSTKQLSFSTKLLVFVWEEHVLLSHVAYFVHLELSQRGKLWPQTFQSSYLPDLTVAKFHVWSPAKPRRKKMLGIFVLVGNWRSGGGVTNRLSPEEVWAQTFFDSANREPQISSFTVPPIVSIYSVYPREKVRYMTHGRISNAALCFDILALF